MNTELKEQLLRLVSQHTHTEVLAALSEVATDQYTTIAQVDRTEAVGYIILSVRIDQARIYASNMGL